MLRLLKFNIYFSLASCNCLSHSPKCFLQQICFQTSSTFVRVTNLNIRDKSTVGKREIFINSTKNTTYWTRSSCKNMPSTGAVFHWRLIYNKRDWIEAVNVGRNGRQLPKLIKYLNPFRQMHVMFKFPIVMWFHPLLRKREGFENERNSV